MDILLRGPKSLSKVLQRPRSKTSKTKTMIWSTGTSICADSRERKVHWKPLRSNSKCLLRLLIGVVNALCVGPPKKPWVQRLEALSWWRTYACQKWLQNPAIAQQWPNWFLSCLYLPRKFQQLLSMFQGICLFFSFLSSI